MILLAACAKPGDEPSGEPNRYSCKGYPEPRVFIESQSWWQEEGSVVAQRQALHDGVGGHVHIGTCFPVNQNLKGRTHFDIRLQSHQSFTGHGDKVDIGLAPGGSSLARVGAPDMACPPKPALCEAWVGMDLDNPPGGSQSLRFRYLPAHHPNGERHFVGSEFATGPFTRDPGLGGKGWYEGVDYANARIRSPLPRGPVSGRWTFDFYAKGDAVQRSFVHVDARFAVDDFGAEVFRSDTEYRGPVTIDTTQFTDGVHCIALRADAPRGDGGTLTGVFQFAIQTENGNPEGNGKGQCAPGT